MRSAIIAGVLLIAVAAAAQTYDLTERYHPQQVLNVWRETTMQMTATTDDPEVQKELEGGFSFHEKTETRCRIMRIDKGLPVELRVFIAAAVEESEEPQAGKQLKTSPLVGKTITVTLSDDKETYRDGRGQEISEDDARPWHSTLPVELFEGLEVRQAKIGDEWVPPKSKATDIADLHIKLVEVLSRDGRELARLEMKLGSPQPIDDSENPLMLTEMSGECLFDLGLGLPYTLEINGRIEGTLEPGEGEETVVLSGPVGIRLRIEAAED